MLTLLALLAFAAPPRHTAHAQTETALPTGAAGLTSSAAAKRPMRFADLQAIKRMGDPQISPGGHWVLFSVLSVDLPKNAKTNHLFVVPLPALGQSAPASQPSQERQLTSGDGETSGRFSPDGKQVAYVVKGQIQLAAWEERTGQLGQPHALTSLGTEADGPVWSPDSKRLLFVSSVYPECSDRATWAEEAACNKEKDDAVAKSPIKAQVWTHLLYRHWNAFTGEKRSHVLVVRASDGSGIRDLTPRRDVGDAETPTFSLGGPIGYAWAPDSREIAYVTNLDEVKAASTNNDIFTLRLDEPGAKPVKISTSPGSDDAPAYSPDGRYLAFRSQARAGYESDRFRLMLYERAAKTISEPIRRLDSWVDEFRWAPDARTIFLVSGEQGEANILALTLGRPDLRSVASHADYSDLAIAPDGKSLVATAMTIQSPAALVVFHGEGELGEYSSATGSLSKLNSQILSQLDLPAMESFRFPGANDTSVQAFLIRPPGFDPAKKYPLKFLIHGGPQGAWGDAWSYRWNPELFAANGYVVVMINPRGSTGYGQKFIDEINGDWGGKPYVDLMRGLDYTEQHYPFIDKSRECALGASYGGFMANWILTHSDRFACIVTHDGMYNPAAAYGTTEEIWFNEWEFRRQGAKGPEREPGQPWRYAAGPAAQDPFRKWSPMLSIQNAKTPTLVIHGQRDYRLDVSEGLQLFTALQRRGVPSEMLYFPDEGHWVLKPQNSELWYRTVNDWCDRWTHTNAYANSTERSPSAPAAAKTGTAHRAARRPARTREAVDEPAGPVLVPIAQRRVR